MAMADSPSCTPRALPPLNPIQPTLRQQRKNKGKEKVCGDRFVDSHVTEQQGQGCQVWCHTSTHYVGRYLLHVGRSVQKPTPSE